MCWEEVGKNSVEGFSNVCKFDIHVLSRRNSLVFCTVCSYFQKVPESAPQLDYKATHGLVEPEAFSAPELSPLWTAKTYQAFDSSKFPNAQVLVSTVSFLSTSILPCALCEHPCRLIRSCACGLLALGCR